MSLLKKLFGKKEGKSKAAIEKEPPKAGTTVLLSGNHQGGKAVAPRAGQMKQAEQITKDAEDYRKEGIELEQQEKYEESEVKVLWRYTVGGNNSVFRYFEPDLISINYK